MKVKLSLYIQREVLDTLTMMAVAGKYSVTEVIERLALAARQSHETDLNANQGVQHG